MKLLNPDRYEVEILECDIQHKSLCNLRNNSVEKHRCLNYTVRVVIAGDHPYFIHGGIPMDRTQGPYAHIIRFFNQIGCFCDPDDFDEKEIEGRRVLADTGITYDRKLGLRPYIIRFYPLS